MKELESRYRKENGRYLIELKLTNSSQLFNSFDPSPFHEKDLDDDAEDYIVGTVREFSLKTPLKLVIHLVHGDGKSGPENAIQQAINNFFEYKSHLAYREMKHILRLGRTSLIIGLIFLFSCISLREAVAALGSGMFYEILQEGLLISGWVAMWRPIQTFLYDWWPIRRLQRVYEKLGKIETEVISPSAGIATS